MKRDKAKRRRCFALVTAALFLALGYLMCVIHAPVVMAQNDQDVSVSVRQIDKANFPTLDVYASVVDTQGQPVRGVTTSSFSLFENGFPIDNIIVEAGKAPVITILVLDRSGSMTKANKMQGAQDAAIAFVNLLRSGDSVGLIAFDTQVSIPQELTDDRSALVDGIRSISPGGRTACYDALWVALEKLDPIAGRKSIILLTDGLDNESKHSAEEVIEFSEGANIPIYTIGLGDKSQDPSSEAWINEELLTQIAQESGGSYSFSPAPDQLASLYALLSEQMQNEYKISYLSPNVNQDGNNRQIKLVVTHSGKSFEAVGRYNPGGVIPVVQTQPEAYWGPFALAFVILLTLLMIPKLLNGIGLLLASDTKTSAATMPTPTTPSVPAVGKIKLGPMTGPDMSTTEPRVELPVVPRGEPEILLAPRADAETSLPHIRFRDAGGAAVSESPASPIPATGSKPSRPRIRLGEPSTSPTPRPIPEADHDAERERKEPEKTRTDRTDDFDSTHRASTVKLREPPSDDSPS